MTTYNNNKALTVKVNDFLPAVTNKSVTYSSTKGAYLTDGWTSAAGNTYGQLMYLSPQLAIVCDFGVGYARTFLNGLKVLRYNGRKAELIDSRYYNCFFYNDAAVRREAAEIVSEFIDSQLRLTGAAASSSEIKDMANKLIGETVDFSRKRLGC